MSYIFSSNGNEYTFKKMDNMLINLPDKDGKHVLIRSSKDGDTKYSWDQVNLIVNVNDIVEFNYNPKESISINNVVKTFTVPMGMSILSIHVVVYNYETDSFKDCYTIEDVLNKNYYFRILLGDQVVFNAKIIDTLNNLYVMDYTTTFYNSDQETLKMRVESNMISLSFLAGVDSICMLFQNVSSPESENA